MATKEQEIMVIYMWLKQSAYISEISEFTGLSESDILNILEENNLL